MRTLRGLTVEEVTGILSRGTFAELISTVEHVQFECKGRLYDTKTVKSKIELAKDISALANSRGGHLLIGPATKKNPLHHGDEVISVSEFTSSAFHPDTYRDILSALIYPPITDLKIEWHPSSVNPRKGIASIYVPPSRQMKSHSWLSKVNLIPRFVAIFLGTLSVWGTTRCRRPFRSYATR
jgi:hypothetical protein